MWQPWRDDELVDNLEVDGRFLLLLLQNTVNSVMLGANKYSKCHHSPIWKLIPGWVVLRVRISEIYHRLNTDTIYNRCGPSINAWSPTSAEFEVTNCFPFWIALCVAAYNRVSWTVNERIRQIANLNLDYSY